ncbi:AI-2E family transporter [Bacteroidia bacterium]|nr:AI-2E family transporter [Bacteroidia bacterium]
MYEGKHFNEKIRQIGFLLILVFLACLIVQELRFFVGAILGGFTIFMVLRGPHRYLRKKGWSNGLTTAFLMISTFLFLVLVIGGLISIFYGKMKSFGPQVIMDGVHHIRDVIMHRWNYDIFSTDVIQKALDSVGNFLPALLAVTGNVVANTIMMMFVLFFLLQQRVQFERGIEGFMPISRPSVGILKRSVHSMVMTNAVGIPLVMFGQALLAGLAYWVLDAGDPVIWGLMTSFFGLIPVVGTAGIWVPLSIELLVGGHVWQGIVLALYGACVISAVDNGVRMVFLKKKANVHPLITLFGVILGMNLFGFWGIIFGPLMLSGFFLLIRIYNREFSTKKTNEALDEI